LNETPRVHNAACRAKLEWAAAKEFATANDIGVQLYGARDPNELRNELASIAQVSPDILVVLNDPFMFTYRKIIVDAVAQLRLPAIYGYREYADDGGMISYGASITDTYRRAAGYVDKILRGLRPADLPIELPTRFELVINLKTAKALGLEVPPTLLARADEVIE
jgi:putative ABC transport system substrate-binding protein